MKVLILGDINSIHLRKWCTGLAEKGVSIGIFSLSAANSHWFEDIEQIEICAQGAIKQEDSFRKKLISKVQYLKVLPELLKVIKSFKPTIVHAHYASSYGLLGALSGFHPFYISVWGSDVFDFPNKGALYKTTLKTNFKKADKIFSTSHVMAEETKRYTSKDIQVIPFGVDLNVFKPASPENQPNGEEMVIGVIKSLEEEYAIDVLIKSFALLKERNKGLALKLLIVGKGSLEKKLKDISVELRIASDTDFVGFVDHQDIPKYHNMIDVFVCVSNSESFGVAVVEAMACSKPVVVSNIGGLPEVVEDGVSGLVVPPKNIEKTAEAIEKLIQNDTFRAEMGKKGRERVESMYDWNKCLIQMMKFYNTTDNGKIT